MTTAEDAYSGTDLGECDVSLGAPDNIGTRKDKGIAVIGSSKTLRRLAIAGTGVLLLGGCSFSLDSLWPSTESEPPAAAQPALQPAAAPAPVAKEAMAPAPKPAEANVPQLNTTNFQVQRPRPGTPTGTFVGQKITQLRQDLSRLQDSIQTHNRELQGLRKQTISNAQGYHGTIAAIESRLQVGTTPGNPLLVDKWNQAQRQLEEVNADIGEMNALANRVSADAALSTYLLESVRAAYGLSGAVEEDHTQLAVLEDDTNRTVVLIDRLLTELSDDIRRQSAYVSNERADINTMAVAIKHGELFGSSLRNRAAAQASVAPAASAYPRGAISTQGRRPLVVIRFDRPKVDYEQALYTAVSRALERRPDAFFDVVAVSPQTSNKGRTALDANAVRRNAQQVLRALTDMGLPTDRTSLSATSSTEVKTNEVRIYVR